MPCRWSIDRFHRREVSKCTETRHVSCVHCPQWPDSCVWAGSNRIQVTTQHLKPRVFEILKLLAKLINVYINTNKDLIYTHTHTQIHIYMYIYMCMFVYTYIYICYWSHLPQKQLQKHPVTHNHAVSFSFLLHVIHVRKLYSLLHSKLPHPPPVQPSNYSSYYMYCKFNTVPTAIFASPVVESE